MSRIKTGVTARKKHKKILKQAKGYKLGRKNIFRLAKQAVIRAKSYSYRDRKVKKRTFRSLWIIRLNAAARQNGLTYKELIFGLKKAKINLNRKVLAQLALEEPKIFSDVVSKVKKALK